MPARECRPITQEETEASKAGYHAFDPDKNADDVNLYSEPSLRDMFFVGWTMDEMMDE